MKRIENKKLQSQITRNHNRIFKDLRDNGSAETKLFKFIDVKRTKDERLDLVWKFKVIVKETGEEYLVTQSFFLGSAHWSLFQE